MVLLEVSHVSRKENGVFAVDDFSFTQASQEKIAIAGETGSGKTSLLKMIGGLLQPDSGRIVFEKKKVRGPHDQLVPGHAGIAYLSQHFELRNNYRVHEILSYANDIPDQQAKELYRLCRIDNLSARRTDQLSGGERQRIALARLLIQQPRLLLLDEPFSNLDAPHREIMQTVINEIIERGQVTCILVSHDAPDILPWADTILVMKNGRLLQQGHPESVYRKPADSYVAGLFGAYNLIHSTDAALLSAGAAPGAGKTMMIRPEQLLVSKDKGALAAIVQKIDFMGSYYLLEAVTRHAVYKVRLIHNVFVAGTTIYLSVLPGTACYL